MPTHPHFTPLRRVSFGAGRYGYARDRDGQPEHAVWRSGRIEWVRHNEGAFITPYDGPLSALPEQP